MIEVLSYLKVNNDFINVFDFAGCVKDDDYIEGAISLCVNYVELINIEMWDYIDQLWAYILDGLESIRKNIDFECSFPDQPISVSFVSNKENVLVSIKGANEKKVSIDKKELINFLALHIEQFFIRLGEISGIEKGKYNYEIEKARSLIEIY